MISNESVKKIPTTKKNTQEVKNEHFFMYTTTTQNNAHFWHTLPFTKQQTDKQISNTKKMNVTVEVQVEKLPPSRRSSLDI